MLCAHSGSGSSRPDREICPIKALPKRKNAGISIPKRDRNTGGTTLINSTHLRCSLPFPLTPEYAAVSCGCSKAGSSPPPKTSHHPVSLCRTHLDYCSSSTPVTCHFKRGDRICQAPILISFLSFVYLSAYLPDRSHKIKKHQYTDRSVLNELYLGKYDIDRSNMGNSDGKCRRHIRSIA